jgi:hypothetical protein
MLDIAKMKRTHQIVESIKFGMYAHLTHGKTNKHNATREILRTSAPIQATNDRKVAKHLGFDRKCIHQTLQCHLLVDDGALDFWIGTKKAQAIKCSFNKGQSSCCGVVDHRNNHMLELEEGLQEKDGVNYTIEYPTHLW